MSAPAVPGHDVLVNHCADLDLGTLFLAGVEVHVGDAGWEAAPLPVPHGNTSRKEKGKKREYVVNFEISGVGELWVKSIEYVRHGKRFVEPVDRMMDGSVWLVMRHFVCGPAFRIPVRSGVVECDSNKWIIEDQAIPTVVLHLVYDAGVEVSLEGTRGFMPKQLISDEDWARKQDLVGKGIYVTVVKRLEDFSVVVKPVSKFMVLHHRR